MVPLKDSQLPDPGHPKCRGGLSQATDEGNLRLGKSLGHCLPGCFARDTGSESHSVGHGLQNELGRSRHPSRALPVVSFADPGLSDVPITCFPALMPVACAHWLQAACPWFDCGCWGWRPGPSPGSTVHCSPGQGTCTLAMHSYPSSTGRACSVPVLR